MRDFYKTKPCTIEAVQWNGDNLIEVVDFGQGAILWDDKDGVHIETLEGRMKANVNDFIIKGLKGEFYPCKPDVFNQKYDRVSKIEVNYGELKLFARECDILYKLAEAYTEDELSVAIGNKLDERAIMEFNAVLNTIYDTIEDHPNAEVVLDEAEVKILFKSVEKLKGHCNIFDENLNSEDVKKLSESMDFIYKALKNKL